MTDPDRRAAPGLGDRVGANRLFAAGPRADLAAHHAMYGKLDHHALGRDLAGALERSGLIGRGGAGFPAGRKLAAMPPARGMWAPSSVVIANGAEGEPRSVKDAHLLRDAPHLVIDGMLAVAAAVNADRLHLYAPATALPDIRTAIRHRHDARRIHLDEAPETFISGEASAVVNAIQKGMALPTDRIARLTESGLQRRPTLLHNVETLAHVGLIARYGPEWFRSLGSADDPGTRLVTISGAVYRETVLEVAGDTPLRDIISTAGLQPGDPAAVLVGGYHGAWIPATHLDVRLSPAGLAPHGAHPGAGILYVLSRRNCGLLATAEIVRYLAGESADQCGPCRFGLPEMAGALEGIAHGSRDPHLPQRALGLAATVAGRGACHHPDGTARLVRSALSVFADDVAAHRTGRCLRSP